jgi:hypothetical protein
MQKIQHKQVFATGFLGITTFNKQNLICDQRNTPVAAVQCDGLPKAELNISVLFVPYRVYLL